MQPSQVILAFTSYFWSWWTPHPDGGTPMAPFYETKPLPIDHIFDNQAASWNGSTGNFDGRGGTFPAEYLPPKGLFWDHVNYTLPEAWGHSFDNAIADGQVLVLPHPEFLHAFHVLYAGDWIDGESGARFKFTFEDGSEEEAELSVKNWWTLHWLNVGPIKAPYHFDGAHSKNGNLTQIHQWTTSVSSVQRIRSITLPQTQYSWNRLHVFAISLAPSHYPHPDSSEMSPNLVIRRVQSTTNWEMYNGERAQIIEVTVANMLAGSFASNPRAWLNKPYEISIFSPGKFTTVRPGVVVRLMPSGEAIVEVLVVPEKGILPGTTVSDAKIELRDREGGRFLAQGDFETQLLEKEWKANAESLSKHQTPKWWNQGKFGIFIHWGIYAVPAYGPPGYYAAWYWWWMHDPHTPQYKHHKETYGTDLVYDDFLKDWTATKFNASEWVKLFDDAGAKYFVIVSKHHDGFAIFDTEETTHRSSVHLGPKRDFLKEIMDAAKTERPHLHRGTYYSMPEWFNPDAAPYGFGNWPGGEAHNAFNRSQIEPYTGRLNASDYIKDIQLAHMRMLADKYESEIMWCDIGGPNDSLNFAAEWYNNATRLGRQVTMNNRCGAAPDFDTPEYTRFSSIQTHKWETSEGIDPWCYGFNRATKPEAYRSAKEIIHTLVDIVSKNGNYLLNLGPNEEGEIIKPMVDRLLDVGRWLKHSGDCVYNTDYWSRGGELEDLRFTTTMTTFCIISLTRPKDGVLFVDKQVPILPGDEIELLGAPSRKGGLPWSNHEGKLAVIVSKEELDSVDHAWAFRIKYNIVEGS